MSMGLWATGIFSLFVMVTVGSAAPLVPVELAPASASGGAGTDLTLGDGMQLRIGRGRGKRPSLVSGSSFVMSYSANSVAGESSPPASLHN